MDSVSTVSVYSSLLVSNLCDVQLVTRPLVATMEASNGRSNSHTEAPPTGRGIRKLCHSITVSSKHT